MKLPTIAMLLCVALRYPPVAAQIQQPVDSPEARQLCEQMGHALGKYVVDGSNEEGVKCDQLIDTILARQDLTSDHLQAVAQVARMRKQPQKAISAIERALAQYPDAKFPMLAMPGRIVGQCWIASIARQNGDLQRARTAYEAVMQDAYTRGEGEENRGFRILVSLLQADCFVASGDADKARQTLRTVPSTRSPYASPVEWTDFYQENLEKGSEQARQARRQTPILRSLSLPMAEAILIQNGVGMAPILLTYGDASHDHEVLLYAVRQAAGSKQSGIEGEAARYFLGMEYLNKTNDFAKAKGYFEALSKSDSFFAPEAGLRLLECTKKEQKAKNVAVDTASLVQELKARFPGYAPAIDEVNKAPVHER
ncbi:MAG: hypothetical protein HZB26_16070 [Candidatus Hydrogenedentes bacterium]|nr:hypothetical protein [Candidatus Hydrogenedentota bacterium]